MSETKARVNSHLNEQGDVSAEYVIAHATRQRQRGRNPAVAYKGIKNPRKALEAAQTDIDSRSAKAGIPYGEDFRFIYKFEPPVEIDADKFRELSEDGIICTLQIGEGPINNRRFLTVGSLEEVMALVLTGPDSWDTLEFKSRRREIRASLPETYGDPVDVAEQLTALLGGEHIGHIVSYDKEASDKNIMGNPNCW